MDIIIMAVKNESVIQVQNNCYHTLRCLALYQLYNMTNLLTYLLTYVYKY